MTTPAQPEFDVEVAACRLLYTLDRGTSDRPLVIKTELTAAYESGRAVMPEPVQPDNKSIHMMERWNIEWEGDDLMICFNDHEKSQHCEYERYVSAQKFIAHPVQQAAMPEPVQPAAAPSQPGRDDITCVWTESDPWSDMPSTYQSICGELWSFIDGGPKENKVRFCHGCGCAVNVTPYIDEDDAAIAKDEQP